MKIFVVIAHDNEMRSIIIIVMSQLCFFTFTYMFGKFLLIDAQWFR
jgi:hypothetical protein